MDGLEWERVAHDPEVFGGTDGRLIVLQSVTAGGPGLVAVGSEDGSAAVWTSTDGTAWQRLGDDGSIFGSSGFGRITDVTVGVPGLVAVGAEDQSGAVWTSTDGTDWSRGPGGAEMFASELVGDDAFVGLDAVSSGGPGLVAFSTEGYPDQFAFVVAAWTSVDGLTWQRVPSNDDGNVFTIEGYVTSVIEGGPGLVAVGGDFAFVSVLVSGPDLTD